MNQIDTNSALKDILKLHSYGNDYFEIESDCHLIAEFRKPSGFLFWVTSQENEFTIGCDNIAGECIWHLHISSKYGCENESQISGLSNELSKIFNNKSKIHISTNDEERYWKEIS